MTCPRCGERPRQRLVHRYKNFAGRACSYRSTQTHALWCDDCITASKVEAFKRRRR